MRQALLQASGCSLWARLRQTLLQEDLIPTACRIRDRVVLPDITRFSFGMNNSSSTKSTRFREAVAAIDAANSQDPQMATWNGQTGPRELLFARRVYEWVERLDASAGEPLLLAARAHTLQRWEVPRSNYEMNRRGYHAWRDACAEHHAEVAKTILGKLDYDTETIDRVKSLILKKYWPVEADARTLEDADCLAFLEMKLAHYADEWERPKAVNILKRTLRKMTPRALELASTLTLDSRAAGLLREAMGS